MNYKSKTSINCKPNKKLFKLWWQGLNEQPWELRHWDREWEMLEKLMFVSHIKHTQRKINGSTSFTIDNMYYVNFRI